MRFAYPLSKYIMLGKTLKAEFDKETNKNHPIWTIQERYRKVLALSEIIRIHYYAGKGGWTKGDTDYYRRLLRVYEILWEEDPCGGGQYLTVNAHHLHTFCDYQVVMWGEPSNSACWARERKVKEFLNVPTNGKNLARSMAIAAAVLETVSFYLDRPHGNVDYLFKPDPVSQFVHRLIRQIRGNVNPPTLTQSVFQVKSEEAAKTVVEVARYNDELREKIDRIGGLFMKHREKTLNIRKHGQITTEHTWLMTEVNRHFPGTLTRKKGFSVSRSKFNIYWRHTLTQLPQPILPVFHDDKVVRVGEVVAVSDPNNDAGAIMYARVEAFYRVEVLAHIKTAGVIQKKRLIFTTQIDNGWKYLFHGFYYNKEGKAHSWTQDHVVYEPDEQADEDVIKPITMIMRKVILIDTEENPSRKMVCDLYRKTIAPYLNVFDEEMIPPYPQVADVVSLPRLRGQIFMVDSVDDWNNEAHLIPMERRRQTQRSHPNRYYLSGRVNPIPTSIKDIWLKVPGEWTYGRIFEGEDLGDWFDVTEEEEA